MTKSINIYRTGRIVKICGQNGTVIANSVVDGKKYATVRFNDGAILSIFVRSGRTTKEDALKGQISMEDVLNGELGKAGNGVSSRGEQAAFNTE